MTGRPDAFMSFYIGDYLADTMHLTTLEHGAYLLLIMRYWRCGALPDNDVLLARITGMGASEWRRSGPVIRKFFKPAIIDGEIVLTHTRIERELVKAGVRYDKAVSGATARWSRRDATKHGASNAPGNAPSIPQASIEHGVEQCESQSQSQSKKKEKANAFSSDFENWYDAFPRHEAGGDAEKAYRAARKSGATAEELISAARRYAASRIGEDAKFTKLPAGWLRAKRWLDEAVQKSNNRLGFVDLLAEGLEKVGLPEKPEGLH